MHHSRRPLRALIVLIALLLGARPADALRTAFAGTVDADRQALLSGTATVGVGGGAVAGPLALYSPGAFAVVTGTTSEGLQAPVVAAAPFGSGRAVAFGHDAFLNAASRQVGQTGQLLLNSVRWAARAQQPLVAVLVKPADQTDLVSFLQASGLQTQVLQSPVTSAQLAGVGAVMINRSSLAPQEISALQSYLGGGGGLVIAGLGWGWKSLNPSLSLLSYPLNDLLAPAGMAWADTYMTSVTFATQHVVPPYSSADSALDLFLGPNVGVASAADLAQALGTLRLAASVLPASASATWSRAEPLISVAATVVPTEASPVTPTSPPGAMAGMPFLIQRQLLQPYGSATAHPAASNFPGAVSADAARVSRSVLIDASASLTATGERWYSTGMYAAPGEPVSVQIPPAATTKGLRIRIGAHSDSLWKREEWWRIPVIDRVAPLTAAQTSVASSFGGLVYLVVPAGSDIGAITITVSGAVEAPRFVLGQTSLDAWRSQIRYLPGPWAELESASLILTVQSETIRTLENPDALLQFWDRVQEANRDLAGWAPGRGRPMRLVFDRQPGSGYMHSGYPIVAFASFGTLTAQRDTVSVLSLSPTEGARRMWGQFHELGHNHQSSDWTFDGTAEVTVNLFTMHAIEEVFGVEKQDAHDSIAPAAQRLSMVVYFSRGAPYQQWKSEPFTALTMYIQLIDAFGWDSFKTVFREYLALPENQRPAGDAAKRDQWLVRYSRTVGRNLGPFFEAWHIPTSAAARQSVADLPAWMPDSTFPAQYSHAVFLPGVHR